MLVWFSGLALQPPAVAPSPPAPASPAATRPATPQPTPAAPATDPTPPPGSKPLVPVPHPLITEVLFAVPTGEKGDANGDGKRDVAGDEFIELVNPHAQPIELGGYRLSDRSAGKKDALVFTFPACRLLPGQVVVVFNGHQSTFSGPVGDPGRPPTMPNDRFHHALVFTMNNTKSRVGLANGGDMVVLTSPDGQAVEVVSWGQFDEKVPAALLVETAPATAKGSITRQSLTGPFIAHDGLGVPFSPGEFPPVSGPRPAKPDAANTPADAAGDTTPPTTSPTPPAIKPTTKPAKKTTKPK